MRGLRPLEVLVVGPLGAGAVFGISFALYSPLGSSSVALAASCGAIACLPFFAGLAWAVAPARLSDDPNRVLQNYQRFSRHLSLAGFVALAYLTGCVLFRVNVLLGAVGDCLLIGCLLTLLAMSLGKVIMHERLNRLRELGS